MKLSEVCLNIVDCPHSTAPDEGSGYALVRTPNIGKGRFNLEGVHRISEAAYKKRCTRITPIVNDLILAREAPAGNVAIIKENMEPLALGQRTVLIRPNPEKVCPDFLVYYLLAPQQQNELLGRATGATVAHVNIPIINNLPVSIPPLKTQKKIAGILSAYDDLIENNRKQIKLLEEAAQKLYKEWFVKFNFPGHENVKIIDGVPEGWIETDINSICTKINAGGTPNRKKTEYWNNKDVKWFKTKELQDCWLYDSEEYISQKGLENSSAKIFPENTILMAIYASPTLGRLGILTNEACCNQAALCMIANEEIISYQWLYLKLLELREYFNSVARGAGQQNISADVVKNRNIVLPPKSLLDNFTKIIEPYFDKIKSLQNQIQLLQSARDKLLPTLMKGDIDV